MRGRTEEEEWGHWEKRNDGYNAAGSWHRLLIMTLQWKEHAAMSDTVINL